MQKTLPTTPSSTERLEAQSYWLLRWDVTPRTLHRKLRSLGGTLVGRRPDGAWRLQLPGESWRADRFSSRAMLEPEPRVERIRRPFSASGPPAALGQRAREIFVRDARTGRPLVGVTVVLQGVSGLCYRAVTTQDGHASIGVLDEPLVGLDALPRDAYWPGQLSPPPGSSDPAGISSTGSAPLEINLEPISPLDSPYGWGATRAMKIDEAHRQGISGAGVRVAVLDTGVSPHPDLKISGGVNTADVEPAEHWQDTHWHGTHVAGILAARGAPGALLGVAPGAELYAVRVGQLEGATMTRFSNALFETDLLEGISWCVAQRIDVLNLSLYARQTSALDALIEEAYHRGVILVAPSGNRRSAFDGDGVDYPARHPRVISVGAVGRLETYPAGSYFARAEQGAVFSPRFRDYYVPGFSKGGQGLDFVAPGVAILSTVPTRLQGWDVDNDRLFGYTSWMGTSQASPFIAGLIALILEAHPELRALTDHRRVDGVREVLRRAAVSLHLDPNLQGAGLPLAPACVGAGWTLG